MAHINLSDASPEYLALARKCILLTDVCSQMSRDWINDGKPYDNPNITNFDWTPTNNCASDPNDQYHKFKFQDIIWTSFRYGSVKVEPAAFIATHPGHPKTAFLIYRGSQTGADFGLDFQYDTVPNPLGAGRTEVGFTKYFKGLGLNATDDRNIGKKVPGFTLYDTLKRLNQTDVRHLIVSGHSLGSTTATLSGAYAIQQQFFQTVETYVSASPQVGDFDFGVWYDELKDSDGNELYKNTYRLTNTADSVPKEPNKSAPVGKKVYVAVGKSVEFTADYGSEAKNHNPCCTYSYALHNPTDPINPDLACDFPVNQGLGDVDEPEFRTVHTSIPRITRERELVTYRGAT